MNMKHEALRLAEQHGFHVFPVSHPAMGGPAAGKRPLIKGWQNQASIDTGTIDEWWDRFPEANIGIATGKKYGLAVLDVDVKSGGLDSLEGLLKTSHIEWTPSAIVKTGSGGLHLYFAYPSTGRIANSASSLAPGLDVRGDGGQVVAPPSIHACGSRYEWLALN